MARDDDAFAEFVATRSVALLRTAYLLTGDQERADELVRESLIRAYPTWRGIREPRAAESKVRTAMARTLISRWRRPTWAAAGTDQRHGMHVGRLWPIVQTLPPRERAVIVLRYHEDLSVQETAAVLSCSTRSAERHNVSALSALRPGAPTGSDDLGAALALEDRLRRELRQEADDIELRPDFVTSSVESVLTQRRDRRRFVHRAAVVLAVLVVGGAAIAIVGGNDDRRKSEVEPPILPVPSPPPRLDAKNIQRLPPPEDVAKLVWRDTALPQALPDDVASAPPLSSDPIDHALALVAGPGAAVGVVG